MDDRQPRPVSDEGDSGASGPDATPSPRWCVVANVVAQRLHGSDGEVRHGTKHFSGGTKVYLVSAYWGMGAERVTVLGLARRPRRWITVDIPVRVLENWRAKLVYDPAVLRRLPSAGPRDEEEARRLSSTLTSSSMTDRVRLIETEVSRVQDIEEDVRSAGRATLHASLPVTPEPGHPVGFVLHDGAKPVAGAIVFQFEDGRRSWRSIWVVNDRHDALAELIVAIQRRHPDTALWWLPELITQIRLARAALDVPGDRHHRNH